MYSCFPCLICYRISYRRSTAWQTCSLSGKWATAEAPCTSLPWHVPPIYFGAGKPERAVQTLRFAILIAAGFGLVVSIVMQYAAEPVVSLFTDRNAAEGADVIRSGGQYLRGYIWDCIFAGIHFSFSGYFCACGKSGLSFLHNIIAIMLVRVPGVYLTSQLFPTTLLPMGLATAAGSFVSVLICVAAFAVIRRKGYSS